MNVSVVRKKFAFYIIYAFFDDDDEKLLIFCCLFDFIYICLFHTVWSLAIVCVKFCNNIKRRLSITPIHFLL